MDILDDNLLTKWKEQQFNKVFCFYVMQRIVDDKKAYTNMYKLLKAGGEILVAFPGKHGFDEVSPFLANIQKYTSYREELFKMKFHASPKEDYVSHSTQVLKNIGFNVITCKTIPITFQLNSINDFVEIYGLASRLSDILPEDLFNEAMEDVKTIIPVNNLFGHSNGNCYVNYELIILITKKPLQE
ncbi:hypothetical protein O3M35_012893 [Rhynocoris fuscipes]|uniref:Uncharacterized protein n=1 Tax=Rhynocoris fuscipes TaxID=488301 RepID=A0AAW1CFC6_9HEMI